MVNVPLAAHHVQAVFFREDMVPAGLQDANFSGLPARPLTLNSTGQFSRFFPAFVIIAFGRG
jgi:hypothetical protein